MEFSASPSKASGRGTASTSGGEKVSTDNQAMLPVLEKYGLSNEEVNMSREKLAQQLASIDPNVQLSPDVERILLELGCKFVESAGAFGSKLAKHRGSENLEVQDLRPYVENVLGVHVPGFGSTVIGNLPASAYAGAHEKGGPGRVNEEHAARMRLRKRTHVAMEENFLVALKEPKARNSSGRPTFS